MITDPKRTVTVNLRSATKALEDIATLVPYMSTSETQGFLLSLAKRYEEMADEQDAARAQADEELARDSQD